MIILQMILGAILHRWRGSGKNPKVWWLNYFIKSKTPKLILEGLMYGGFISFEYGITKGLISAVMFSLLMTFGYGLAMDLGKSEYFSQKEADAWYYQWWNNLFSRDESGYTYQQRAFKDYIYMTIRGLVITAPIGILLMNPVIAVSGGTMGMCYWLGGKISERIWYKDFICISELLFGAVLFSVI